MKIIDPGHVYEPVQYDAENESYYVDRIYFMKRMGENYPGNTSSFPGTNCQEIIRILIDRIRYVDKQKPWNGNKLMIALLQQVLWLFEVRAAENRAQSFNIPFTNIELLPTCKKCGHIDCRINHETN